MVLEVCVGIKKNIATLFNYTQHNLSDFMSSLDGGGGGGGGVKVVLEDRTHIGHASDEIFRCAYF